MKKVFRGVIRTALVLYVVFMLFQLFFCRLSADLTPGYLSEAQDSGYWQTVWGHTNLIPFLTLKEFGSAVLHGQGIFSIAFINLAGNILLFVPIGVFLPYFREKQKRFGRFFLTVVLMIICVELTQVFALIGACDIDDLILNVLGACIGFGFYHITERMLRHGKRTADHDISED